MFKKLKAIALAAVSGLLGLFAVPSFAAIDVTAVTTGITDAGVAISAVIAGLMALSVLIFGVVKVYRFVSRKAGA
jgi:hypothetical protein